MGAMASQTIGVSIVYSTVCSDVDQRNIKALRYWPLWGEFTGNRWIPRTRKMFPFDDAIVFQYRKYTWNTPLHNFGDFVLAFKCYATEIIIWTQVLKTQNTVVCGARLFQWKMYVMAFTSISYSYHGAAWCTGRWATREESKLLVCWMVFNHWWKDMGNYLMQNIWNATYSFIVYPGIYSKMPMSEFLVCNEYGSN